MSKKFFRRTVGAILAVSICMGFSFSALAVEIPDSRTGDVELIGPISARALQWGVDGGREQHTSVGQATLERVWGWSTCKDAAGGNVYHKTTAQYESLILGTPYGSNSNWGYGKVWAYSDYIDYIDVAPNYKARVYYDLSFIHKEHTRASIA